MLALFLFWTWIGLAYSGHIALLPSTGCYSHDIMMRRLGMRFRALNHSITSAQVRVFEFHRNLPANPPEWKSLVHRDNSTAVRDFMHWSEGQMWTVSFPFDLKKFWDTRAALALFSIHGFHMKACADALRNPSFFDELGRETYDLVVVDYILNECALVLAGKLNASTIYLSNYPSIHSYNEFINIPANPASVPSVLSGHPGRMSFLTRVTNSFFYFLVVATRRYFFRKVEDVFEATKTTMPKQLMSTEEGTLLYATPFEALLDSPRPLTEQFKYLGCDHCHVKSMKKEKSKSVVAGEEMILVSFGSIVHGEHIPPHILAILLDVFGALNQTVIWQFGSAVDRLPFPVPPNVQLYDWLPIRELLRDPRLRLIISHGGITTCLEAVHHGVPVLGIPLQGDQPYNLRRIAEFGAGEVLETTRLSRRALGEKLAQILTNRERYRSNALRLRSMLQDHSRLNPDPDFWFRWALSHGARLRRSRNFFRFRYIPHWTYFNMDVWLVLCAIASSTAAILTLVSAGVLERFGQLEVSIPDHCTQCDPFRNLSLLLWSFKLVQIPSDFLIALVSGR